MRALVILNEQHNLLDEQKQILDEHFGKGNWEIYPVPASGWTDKQQEEIFDSILQKHGDDTIVFASPVPYLQKLCAFSAGYRYASNACASNVVGIKSVLVFHNNTRNKKELPNGRIVYTVAQTGWELI